MSSCYGVQDQTINLPDEPYIIADCQHEVYDCECLFTWLNGKTLCPECFECKFDKMALIEKANLLGCEWYEVRL